MEYRVKKKIFRKEDIDRIYIFFRNGDYLEVEKEEIYKVFIKLCDELVWEHREAVAVAETGYIKLRIAHAEGRKRDVYLYNEKEYRKNRKDYIENRVSVEQGIDRVVVFNENNFHDVIKGDIVAELTSDGFICLKFNKNKIYGPSAEGEHRINLGGVYKRNVQKINLDFENCESFEIFNEEIVDMKLVFKPELEWNSHGYARVVDKGFIRVKLDPKIAYREYNLWDIWTGCGKKLKLSRLRKRLFSKKASNIDICHLYVTYYYAGYGINIEECIEVDEVYPKEDYNPYEEELPCDRIEDKLCDEWEDEESEYELFESGYAMSEPGGTILIKFGELLPKE